MSYLKKLCVLAIAAAAASPLPSLACGHPGDVQLARTFLSVHFPEALWVTGATWEAQQAGLLPMPDPKYIMSQGEDRVLMDLQAHLAAVESLTDIGIAFSKAATQPHSVAVVMVDKMHWARFEPDPAGAELERQFNCVAEGRKQGDLVAVTKELVVHEIRAGRLSIHRAEELGLIRLYGEPAQIAAFRADFSGLGLTDLTISPPAGDDLDPTARLARIRQSTDAIDFRNLKSE